MELSSLEGNIIGVISKDYKNGDYSGKVVKDIVLNRASDALKMVALSESTLECKFDDLSHGNQNRVVLASKLQDKCIILNNFSIGLTSKDIEFFKKLFKRITSYGRKIILVDVNSNLFFNLVDKVYVTSNEIIYETSDMFDKTLGEYIDLPNLVEFTNLSENKGIKINHYKELDELLKAIYRIKS